MPHAHAVGVCDHEGDVGPDFMGARELVEVGGSKPPVPVSNSLQSK